MKKKFFLLVLAGMFLTTYSCREETEMNTDGNMEETETRSLDENT